MEIHIGQLIEKRFRESPLTIGEFARQINKSRQNIYNIFKRPSIDTGLLLRISGVLKFNFFEYYFHIYKTWDHKGQTFAKLRQKGRNKPVNYVQAVQDVYENNMKLEENIGVYKKQSDLLSNENVYLKEINKLLREKLATEKKE